MNPFPRLLTIHFSIIITLVLLLPSCSVSNDSPNKVEQKKALASKIKQHQLTDTLQAKLFDNMIWLDGGSFEMGSNSLDARNRERPAHQVTVDGFYLSRYEVTQDIFQYLMGWNNSYYQCANCPMNNVSFHNMQLFIERLNLATGKAFRLPTEAEWAFAAKGGVKSKGFTYSGSDNIDDVAWYADNSNRQSHPVGLKKPNELGLFDMTGNVWEFCQDDMHRNAYKRKSAHNPLILAQHRNAKTKAMKVLRGGGYEFSAKESLVFIRDGATNNVRMADIGFRLALSK